MKFSDASYALTVGRWRHIQHIHESPARRNPDHLVGRLLPIADRWNARWITRKQLARLRAHAFYYYLVARTRYYDGVFQDAIAGGVRHIINVGSGTDTRAYRFAEALRAGAIDVYECDQPSLIRAKEVICQRRWPSALVSYLPLDLSDRTWPEFERLFDKRVTGPALVLMEGLTPYVDGQSVDRFLDALVRKLPQGSRIAYDFKIRGFKDEFGQGGKAQRPFRLSGRHEDVARYHEERQLVLARMELSDQLSARMLGDLSGAGFPIFREDALVQLKPLRVTT